MGKVSGLGEGVAVGAARPVPLTPMVCVPLDALLAICSVELRVPVPKGVKVIMMVHVPAGVTAAVHPVAAKSPAFPPRNVSGCVTTRLAEPAGALFVMVTLCAGLVVPWPCGAKVSPSVGSVMAGGASMPAPVIMSVCGLLEALSVTVSRVAAAGPVADGVYCTMTVQVPPPADTVWPEQPSPPGGMVKSPLPVFTTAFAGSVRGEVALVSLSVAVIVTLVCRITFPNARGFGEAGVVNCAVGRGRPVPLRAMVKGLPKTAFSVAVVEEAIVSMAVSPVAVEGLKATLMVQEPPPGLMLAQVSVSGKSPGKAPPGVMVLLMAAPP